MSNAIAIIVIAALLFRKSTLKMCSLRITKFCGDFSRLIFSSIGVIKAFNSVITFLRLSLTLTNEGRILSEICLQNLYLFRCKLLLVNPDL